MKKQALLFMASLVTTFSFAQKPSFGLNAGLTHSALRGEMMQSLDGLLEYTNEIVKTSNTNGFYAGGYVNIPLNQSFSVQPAINYTQRGFALKGELGIKEIDFLGINAQAQLKTHYLEMPVQLKANFGGIELFAGPYVSYLAKANLNLKAGALGFNVINETLDASN